MKAEGRERQSRGNADRQPVIQVDYFSASTGKEAERRTILRAVDIQTGLSISVNDQETNARLWFVCCWLFVGFLVLFLAWCFCLVW